ncbi:MAG TPA: MBL fold metallo-hydrolase [Terriglobales bacterium]|nr:MBL fold metallo-hydrolase [Terriglobales bacterium]
MWGSLRNLFVLLFLLTLVPTVSPAQTSEGSVTPPEIKVTILGSGAGPPVRLDRYGPSILVEAGSETLLFDCGRGALIRMTQAGVPLEKITKLFLTHLHSDHIVDIPDLLLTPWSGRTARSVPLEVWGPTGTSAMMGHLQKAFEFDIHVRRDLDEKFSPDGIRVVSHDIKEGTVYEKNGVRVTAFTVDHGPVKPAFGFRIDYAGRSLALSGDTRPSQNLLKFSKGVDVIIHEAVDPDVFRRATTHHTAAQAESIIAHHTTPEQAGEIFTKLEPKLAVFSHAAGGEEMLSKTRKTYSGPLVMGEDLMVLVIGTGVEVRRPGLEHRK